MAITTDDFGKIWASTSPLTPYEFSESHYKEGWNFIGGTPPSRQMWDFLQKNNDEKMQYLANNYLPLSGGTLTNGLHIDVTGGAYYTKRTDITKNVAPTADKYATLFSSLFSGGERNFLIESIINTDKASRTSIYAYSFQNNDSVSFSLGFDASNVKYCYVASDFYANWDNHYDLGRASARWKQVYAGTATINTSDERLKDNIKAIPDEVLDAWGDVNWYQYQFKDSIAEKGETKARIHTGAIAQRIESVFKAHNLDANRYGLLCYDEWKAEAEQKDEDGNVVQEAREAENRYSLRYEEALCMEAAYQRRRADKLEERIAKLEALLRTE